MTEKTPHSNLDNLRGIRIQKLNDLVDKGINPYPYTYERTASAASLQEKYKDLPPGGEDSEVYSIAGRIMAMRNSGMFIDLMDSSGKIQLFIHKDNIDEEKIKLIKLFDSGDIIGAQGIVRRTPRGE